MSSCERFAATHLKYSHEPAIIETATGSRRGQIATPNAIHALSFAPDGRTLATSCADTTVLLWDMDRPLSGLPALPAPKTAADGEKLLPRCVPPSKA